MDFQAERKPLIAPTSAGAGGEEGVGTKKASELWRIHGRHFDLTPFVAHHPVSGEPGVARVAWLGVAA